MSTGSCAPPLASYDRVTVGNTPGRLHLCTRKGAVGAPICNVNRCRPHGAVDAHKAGGELLPSDDWVSCVKDTHGAVRCGVAIFQVAALHDNCGVQIDYGDQGGTLFVLNGTAVSRQRPSDLVYHWCLYAGYCNDGSADAVTDLGLRVSVRVQQATLSSCLGYVCPPGYKEDVGSMAALYVRLNDTETCCTPAPPGPLRRTQSEFHLCSVQRRIVQVRCGQL